MNQYVLCFVPLEPDHYRPTRTVLIEKIKPEWQRGKLNLPGGKVELNEHPTAAVERELMEETGLYAKHIRILGKLTGPDYLIHVARCLVPIDSKPVQMEAELVHNMWIDEALVHPRLIPNLRLIIPLCMAGVTGWTIQDTGQ